MTKIHYNGSKAAFNLTPLHCPPTHPPSRSSPSTASQCSRSHPPFPSPFVPWPRLCWGNTMAAFTPREFPLGQLFTAACESSTGGRHSHFRPAHPQARIKLGLAVWVMAQLCESTEPLCCSVTIEHTQHTHQQDPTNPSHQRAPVLCGDVC